MENTKENKVWEIVQIARDNQRPTAKTLIDYLIEDFIEIHGDRCYGDDSSIITGIGYLDGKAVTIIAEEKGASTKEKIERNFGMPHPEGYRKALRAMQQAEKFHRPIILIIDTPGAYPGVGAEERGQASSIANNLAEMMFIKAPTLAIVLSEGGSGGALAIGVADETMMFENAIYSILSPEGFATILYKDVLLAKYAASIMRITACDLLAYGIIDEIIPEVEGGLHLDKEYSFSILKSNLTKKIEILQKENLMTLLERRHQKYRNIGEYEETE